MTANCRDSMAAGENETVSRDAQGYHHSTGWRRRDKILAQGHLGIPSADQQDRWEIAEQAGRGDAEDIAAGVAPISSGHLGSR